MPHVALFSSSLFLGTILSLSGSHWVFVWLGLELNLMSFIPLLTTSPLHRTAEAAMTYFLAQALGSGLILLGSLSLFLSPQIFLPQPLSSLFLMLGLITKLGLPPCHFWFPSVMTLISWPLCIMLTTWQKLTPMLILFFITLPKLTLIPIVMISMGALIGGTGGMNQTQIRSLLAYSSIGHMTWMFAASTSSFSVSIMYLVSYIIITIPLMLLMWSSSSSQNLISMNINSRSPLSNINLLILIFSLGGIPPFLGFFPKWMVLESLAPSFILIAFILLLGSMLNLYYYMNLVFINLVSPYKLPMFFQSSSSNFTLMPLMATLTLGLAPTFFFLAYALTILH